MGFKHNRNEERWRKMEDAALFFRRLWNAPIPYVSLENPIMHIWGRREIQGVVGGQGDGWRPDQIIQPWMFGHPERKATCLWLRGLPKLIPTNNVKAQMLALPKSQQQRIHYMSPSKNRAALRSKTFRGIAQAMAQQYTEHIWNQMENNKTRIA